MSEQNPNSNTEQQENQPFTPAGFEKRIAAWMGIVYILLIMFAVTFSIFTGGKTLPGTFPLFLVPVAAASIVVTIYRQVKGLARGGLVVTILVCVVCVAAILLGLFMGVPALVSGVQNAFV